MWIKREEFERMKEQLDRIDQAKAQTAGDVALIMKHLGLKFYDEPSIPAKRGIVTEKEYAKRIKKRKPIFGESLYFNLLRNQQQQARGYGGLLGGLW